MITLSLLSDLHTEFMRDGGEAFIKSLDPTGVDVLVLAGDILVAKDVDAAKATLSMFHAQGFEEVVYVGGNHEFYKGWIPNVEANLEQLHNELDWLTVLNPGRVHHTHGHRLLGGTMWYPYRPDNHQYESMMNDFYVIKGSRGNYFYKENDRFRSEYSRLGEPGDIIVTHHLPHPKSIHPRYATSELNRFFLSDMSDLIEKTKPALWLHGHTHDSVDYTVGSTRVVANPRGYPHEVNVDFNPSLRLVISSSS